MQTRITPAKNVHTMPNPGQDGRNAVTSRPGNRLIIDTHGSLQSDWLCTTVNPMSTLCLLL